MVKENERFGQVVNLLNCFQKNMKKQNILNECIGENECVKQYFESFFLLGLRDQGRKWGCVDFFWSHKLTIFKWIPYNLHCTPKVKSWGVQYIGLVSQIASNATLRSAWCRLSTRCQWIELFMIHSLPLVQL